MPPKKPMSDWKHGTHGTYVNGCRCDRCRVASNAYKRALYHHNLAESRRYAREKARRLAQRRSYGDPDQALVRASHDLAFYRRTTTGELRRLIDEQARDDTYYLAQHPLVSFSLDAPRKSGLQRLGYEW